MFNRIMFSMMLLCLPPVVRFAAFRFPKFRQRLQERDVALQIKLQDASVGRCFYLKKASLHPRAP